MPEKSEKSEILSDMQISNLIENLPSIMQADYWTLAYSLNRDGTSFSSFYEKAKKWKYTILVIQDT